DGEDPLRPERQPPRSHASPRKWHSLVPKPSALRARPTSTRKWVFSCPEGGRFQAAVTNSFSLSSRASTLSPVNQPNVRAKSRGRPIRPELSRGSPRACRGARGTTVCVLFCHGAQDRHARPRLHHAVRLRALNGDAGRVLTFILARGGPTA